MGAPAIGAVILIAFPFSDLSASKLRPALVLASAGRNDWICLQITSKPYADPNPVELTDADFTQGSLQRTSYLRPGKLFTAHHSLFQRTVGRINETKLEQTRNAVIEIIRLGRMPESEA